MFKAQTASACTVKQMEFLHFIFYGLCEAYAHVYHLVIVNCFLHTTPGCATDGILVFQ